MTQHQHPRGPRVRVTLPAMEPTALLDKAAPVAIQNLGPEGMGEAVALTGRAADVRAFVAEHWGEDEALDVAERISGGTHDDDPPAELTEGLTRRGRPDVYVVVTMHRGAIMDLEVMDARPTFNDRRGSVRVFQANVNGGDSREMRWAGWVA